MVCSACEKKLAKLAAPDTWKAGSRNVAGGKDGGRLIGENKALTMGRRFQNAYSSKCGQCKMTLHQQGIFCQTCAYGKGVCSMCGKQILDTTYYKQSGGGDGGAAAKRQKLADDANAEGEAAADESAQDRGAQEATVAPALNHLASAKATGAQHTGAHITAALAQQTTGAFLAAAPPFAASAAFTGPRPGFYFGTGSSGTGYYVDPEQRRLVSWKEAQAAQAAAKAAVAAADPANGGSAEPAPPLDARQQAAEAAKELVTSQLGPRPELAAHQQREIKGGGLSSAMGAAGRVLQKPKSGDAAEAAGAPKGWQLDPASGYYFDVETQMYFDPRTKMYYNCRTGEWMAALQGNSAAVAAAQAAAAGVKQPRQRVVDKFGL